MNFFEKLDEYKKKVYHLSVRYNFCDFNARTAGYDDYIEFVKFPLNGPTLNIFENYAEDLVPAKRKNTAQCINTFGKQLLEFYKSTVV